VDWCSACGVMYGVPTFGLVYGLSVMDVKLGSFEVVIRLNYVQVD
jgi:hypothetical protein